MINLEQFNAIAPDTVFAKGETVDSPEGINMTGSGKKLRWLAKKGYANDWTLYLHWATSSWEFIERSGDKSMNMKAIVKLVDCDEAVAQKYRS